MTAQASPMSDISLAGIGAAVGAFFTGLFAWLVQRTKGDSAAEVAAMGEWHRIYNAVSGRLAAVETECAEQKKQQAADMAEMRIEHSRELAEIRAEHSKEIDEIMEVHHSGLAAMRELNEGLMRQIAQNSQSAAQLLSDSPVTHPKDAPDGK